MSTKIYQAYKIKTGRFNDFLLHIRQETIKVAIPRIENLMAAVKPEALAQWLEDYRIKEASEKMQRRGQWEIVLKLLKKNHDNQYAFNPVDLGSGWTFFLDNRYFYGWPWGMIKLSDEVIQTFGDGIKDFCYWNNTDRPDDVSRQEWKNRERKWNQIWNRGEFIHRLDYRILDFSPGAYQSIFEVESILFPDQYKNLTG